VDIIAFAVTVLNYLLRSVHPAEVGQCSRRHLRRYPGGLTAWMILAVVPVTYAFMNSV
jgi:hypothetical protein